MYISWGKRYLRLHLDEFRVVDGFVVDVVAGFEKSRSQDGGLSRYSNLPRHTIGIFLVRTTSDNSIT